MAKKALPPGVEARVKQLLRQTDWETKYPKTVDRLTAYRTAEEQVTRVVLAEEATKRDREAAKAEQAAKAHLKRWGAGGGQR